MSERGRFLLLVGVFLACRAIPFGEPRVQGAILEGFQLLGDYAREHVLLCLVPALFIAGGIVVFLSQGAVMKYLGAKANRVVAYAVASISGSVLAVCSCTVLPLFAGIHRRGAGLGPATAFLYSGPAINVLAIVLTARILGWEIGLARAVGAILFALAVGVAMGAIFRKSEEARVAEGPDPFAAGGEGGVGRAAALLGCMVGLLVSANWARPAEPVGFFNAVWTVKWWIAGAFLAATLLLAWRGHGAAERRTWVEETWTFGKMMLPLLFAGVLVSGVLLGRPGVDAGLVPSRWVEDLVGGNSLRANFFASVFGVFMYFATLTEVPILQGLLGSGMGKGPALALLLSGPAVSLPSLLVLRGVIGTRRTLAYAGLVAFFSTLAGWIFGAL
jgi:uncharacterized membrane protein YraQ (UPF0718 family)